ncbi:hypothetical protein [Acaryochloris sp. IP29b_bin.148]|uniref:hypothetical protein n=1 Tax=Acaryochloris sp. IP29b_bin.148 TaxID=2969218 RepID=UPI002606D0FA|nr:hypothetical protein [Acaryochloris sp. IP29b_bin.148]
MNTTTQHPHIPTSFTPPKPLTQSKSIFSSKTFWGIVFTTVAAIAPIIGESVDAGKFTGSDIAQIVVILCGTGATLVGRVEAGNIYTPNNMPGPNKLDMD